MAEPVPQVEPWPRAAAVAALFAFVVVDLALWAYGSFELFRAFLDEAEREVSEGHLAMAGQILTLALALMLLFGWGWRWAVAAGKIGGRPTARFGGA